MYLNIDEQTVTDLEILGKRNGKGIYELYNRTRTRGGEAWLKHLFLHPLADKEEIQKRISIIEHFSALKTAFPFDVSLFGTAEKYMMNAGEDGKKDGQHHELSEKEIQQGVMAVIDMMQRLRRFVEAPEIKGIAAYETERSAMASVIAAPVLEPVFREEGKDRLSFTAVAAYDALFRLREHQQVTALLKYIHQLDVYASVAQLAAERKFVFPEVLDKGRGLKLEGVYHPELKDPVGNNVSMEPGRNVIFLTGANMAGKSTFLRSVSTALYIAHIGFPVAAKSMAFAVMDGIYTTVNLPDNLGIGASHFYNEVLRVKKVAAELSRNKSLFIVFDELFRGTNVKDAHEGTVAVTSAFSKKKDSLFIVSSHIVEAGDELKQLPSISFLYLPTRMNGHVPEYTYTLEKGITNDRHGMIIIRNEGILDILKDGKKRALPVI